MTRFIPLKDCEEGKIYTVSARNFDIAIYDGKEGFIGIRTK